MADNKTDDTPAADEAYNAWRQNRIANATEPFDPGQSVTATTIAADVDAELKPAEDDKTKK